MVIIISLRCLVFGLLLTQNSKPSEIITQTHILYLETLSAMYQFVCTFLLQKALSETKKLIFAFDKVLKATFSKKLCFEI